MPYAKNVIRVKVPQRSGFDKSHRNSGTGRCGTLTPILCDELIPNSRVSLKINLASQLPPLASDTYMNCKLKVEAFFVPSRLLCASFESFFCDFPVRSYSASSASSGQGSGDFVDVRGAVPFVAFGGTAPIVAGPGSLADYLGISHQDNATTPSASTAISLLPFVAYHLIWQEYYRNPRVQNPAFAVPVSYGPNSINVSSVNSAASIPYTFYTFAATSGSVTLRDNHVLVLNGSNGNDFLCADGVSIFNLRQRNFGLDYFTGCRVTPQQGQAMSVGIDIPAGTDSAGGSTSFTIAQLRAANSLQQFRERNNLPSPRLVDQVKTRYGANLSDGVAQRPICIGSASYAVNTSGVAQNGPSSSSSPSTSNPYDAVGTRYGQAFGMGSDFIINDFTANEPGYLMVLLSFVPEVTYATLNDKMFYRYRTEGSITDMACSLLQNVGDEPVFVSELASLPIGNVFGYNDRYASFMFKPNSAHGLFKASQSLDSFVLQRALGVSTTLNSAFLEIPKDYLKSVLALSSQVSDVDYWYDCYLDYKVSMPLAEFSIPSLQDPAYEHGQSVSIRRNGQIF